MKNHLLFSSGILFLLLTLPNKVIISQDVAYTMNDKENAFVILQLKENGKGQEAMSEPDVMAVVQQIKAINTKLGYAELEKKMASFTLDENGHQVTYLTIRNFNDFTSAEEYSIALSNVLNKDIYGKIKTPFPISQSDYKRCVAAKSLPSYYKYYTKHRK